MPIRIPGTGRRTGESAGQVLSAAETLAEQSSTLRVEVDRLLEEVRAG